MLRASVLAVALTAVVCLPAAAAPPERVAGTSLRAVTFNMLHGGPWSWFTGDDGDLETRLTMIVDELRALRPDVIALQEVPHSRRHGNVAARIAEQLGLHWAHAPSVDRVFSIRLFGWLATRLIGFDAGPAVLTRLPITDTRTHELPRCAQRFVPRVLLEATVQSPVGPLAIFSTHTSRDDCQIARLAELVHARREGRPALVMGDLNSTESTRAIADLIERGFVDAFRAANPDAPGHTVWQRIEAPQPTVARRVDYVFVVRGDAVAPRVRASRVVLDRPRAQADGGVLWPSDHHGVLADIEFEPR
ncbi:MAG TPA: endonuclease/exonuclease/phosphatase family protein [Candidatus Tectomicrobia bacterium]|nr:endonuclease/exonuclease/phosphatase family protein [Candidatus Tectomicrobia bacterium]